MYGKAKQAMYCRDIRKETKGAECIYVRKQYSSNGGCVSIYNTLQLIVRVYILRKNITDKSVGVYVER